MRAHRALISVQSQPRAPPVMPVQFQLNCDVHYCQVDGAYVFLQASRDRYFVLREEHVACFEALRLTDTTRDLSPYQAAFASALVKDGILEDDEGAQSREFHPCQSPGPTASLYNLTLPSRVTLADAVRYIHALHSTMVVWQRYRKRMDRVASKVCHWRRPVRRAASRDEILSVAATFHRLTPYLQTTSDKCLFRSLALVRYLALSQLPASVEIGVRTAPFVAHCWVEHDGIVLNDHLDHVREYQKIWSF